MLSVALASESCAISGPIQTSYSTPSSGIRIRIESQVLIQRPFFWFRKPSDSPEVIRRRSDFIRSISLLKINPDDAHPVSEFGQRLVRDIDDPEIVFRAWLRDTEHYRAPSGSPVHLIENDEAMGRIAAFFTGNMMLAFINQRKKKYGVGWVSIIRNYGRTVEDALDIWRNDPAFKDFPWDRAIILGGDNVIHGLDAQTAAQISGPADGLFVPLFEDLGRRGLKKAMHVSGDFQSSDVFAYFIPRSIRRLFHLPPSRIETYIEDYKNFIRQSIRELVGEKIAGQLTEDDFKLDLMHMGLAQGPAEKPYYWLVDLGERYLWLRPVTGRVAGLLASSHIWFNEMIISGLRSGMRVVMLNPFTILVNKMKYGQSENFWWAITIGLGDTRDWARYNYVHANVRKGTIAHMALFGPVTSLVPASIHRLLGHKTAFFISKDAGMRFHFYQAPATSPAKAKRAAAAA